MSYCSPHHPSLPWGVLKRDLPPWIPYMALVVFCLLFLGTVFQGVTIYIVPAAIGKARCEIFHRQITQNGGQVVSSISPSCTHIVGDNWDDCNKALRLLKVERLPSAVHLVRCTWLSACISEKSLLDLEDYSLLPPESPTVALVEGSNGTAVCPVPDVAAAQDPLKIKKNPQENLSETVPEIQEEQCEEDGVSQNDLEALISGVHPSESNPSQSLVENPVLSGKWVCSQPSTTKGENHNKALGYSKAINALKSYHKPITSYDEACKIPGIGKRMADKIMEITESGHLRKLDHIGEEVPVVKMFTNIWGTDGFRTLEDIRTKAVLNHTLRIGLKHYDDLERMPRSEANASEAGSSQLVVVACGSYRRGKSTFISTFVYYYFMILFLFFHPGFLTDDLVSHEVNGEQKKYMHS
uniref:Polymerase (DNA directed), lambda n=1 Tax=Cyprinus carpio TaxID=7962 RepID=A0A8C1K468_CYPCA